MEKHVENQEELEALGIRLGNVLQGGEVIELVGDVGAGKTTLTKAIAAGMGIRDAVTSPSYTLSQLYRAESGLRLRHYDFYRLNDPGILAAELEEVLEDEATVTIVEWADIVAGILPVDHLQVLITATSETTRKIVLRSSGEKSQWLVEQMI